MMRNHYEGTGFREKLKEFGVLLSFIVIAAFVSLIVMNVLTFPLSLFAVNASSLFTCAVKALIVLSVFSYIVFRIIRRIRISRTEGTSFVKAFVFSALRKCKTVLLAICVLFFLLAVFLFLFLIVKYNYIILYELSQ